MNNPLILLDTHVWIWLMNGDKTLGSSVCLEAINNAAANGNIRISAISIWEIGMLEAKGRISFSGDVLTWVEQALTAPGVRLAPITPKIAIESSRLPGDFHGDPADRIIVAATRELGATLITRDRKIIEYGQAGYVRTLRA
ncbi:type II toxin-antitoxin system VapC family toxin [Desulfonema magnum]|uniref:PIN domain-containing protein n=1 Tax=Desulfonema magnum TaxID=45655 RepID=A0A975GTQ5_9BACT|nr:type II toxin-antitoxin system VapC family toxin [Desulfonema magnum]QTA93360.1 PIN domain-containing protein [Desulfonema magnum]